MNNLFCKIFIANLMHKISFYIFNEQKVNKIKVFADGCENIILTLLPARLMVVGRESREIIVLEYLNSLRY
jgi:hypothetical protein